MHLPQRYLAFSLLAKCLNSLPNLHTLRVCWFKWFDTPALQDALQGVDLPQIKTLIIPLIAYPLLEHCRNVENVACLVGYYEGVSGGFPKSLASNRHSKIKRLAIPLVLRADSSRKRLNSLL